MSTKQSRKTARRKQRQREQRRLAALRERAVSFEGITPARALRMSKEAIENTVRSGKRRRMVSPFDGIALALGAAAMLGARR